MRVRMLVVALLLAGCAAPDTPTQTPAPASDDFGANESGTREADVREAGARESDTREGDARGTPPTSPDAPAPTSPPHGAALEGNRTFSFDVNAYERVERWFLVNATHRAVISLYVRNVEPAARDWPASVLALGPNGSSQADSGMLGEGGASFALRLGPFEHDAGDGPARVGVRVSAGVAAHVEGRVYVDDESDVSTVTT